MRCMHVRRGKRRRRKDLLCAHEVCCGHARETPPPPLHHHTHARKAGRRSPKSRTWLTMLCGNSGVSCILFRIPQQWDINLERPVASAVLQKLRPGAEQAFLAWDQTKLDLSSFSAPFCSFASVTPACRVVILIRLSWDRVAMYGRDAASGPGTGPDDARQLLRPHPRPPPPLVSDRRWRGRPSFHRHRYGGPIPRPSLFFLFVFFFL